MVFEPEHFASRHIGPDAAERDEMLARIGASSLDALIDEAIPPAIRLAKPLDLPPGVSEYQFLRDLRTVASRNQVFRSFIGLGYSRLRHAERHPPQRARKSRLVHALHAVSGRDRSGASRGAAQLPDDGARPDRDGGGERVAAGRGDGGRRGDDDAAPGAGEADRVGRWGRRSSSSPTRAFRRPSRCCARAPSRWASS